MTTTFATTITLKTVHIDYTTAPIIRSVARRDIPEYGLTEGQVFYMAYSATESKAQGKNIYHIVTWDYEKIGWNCPCKATTSRCKHNKAVAKDCSKSHTVQGYKPVSKADTFAALVAKYDVRSQQAQAQAQAQTSVIADAEKVAQEAHNELVRQGAIAETLAQIQEDNRVRANYEQELEEAANYTFRQPVDPSPVRRYFTQAEIEAGLPEQVAQARQATAQREAQLRTTAPLNGNRTFSFMR